MTRTQRPMTPKANCIRVRLWTRRGLRISEEAALSSWLDDWRADQRWRWEGQALAGEMHTSDEFTVSDVVEHLCALLAQPGLVRIDVSAPHLQERAQPAWLKVYRSNPNLHPLCHLYEEGLIPAEIVIQALGGFTLLSRSGQGDDTS